MIPPSTRRRISNTSSKIARVITSGALWSGKGIYVLSTSLLMVGIPWALAYLDEQQVLELEREQKARDSAGEVSRVSLS
jgi:import receptor subunit TOM22